MPPVDFVNYIMPLVDAGLDLVGLDISGQTIEQLTQRAPTLGDRLVVGDLSSLPSHELYRTVVGIQVSSTVTEPALMPSFEKRWRRSSRVVCSQFG